MNMAQSTTHHTDHKAFVVDSVETDAVPACSLCKRIDASGTLPKRLIVCCDGTFNSSNQGVETNPTNIARLSRAIANVGYAADGYKVPQITYYQSGIGTDQTASALTKARQGGFGAGLNGKVCEAYNYLANNYGPGDEIFIFGFSRGAYTARVLASFLCQFGLLTPGMMDYFDEIFEAYKKRKSTEYTFEEMAWSQAKAQPGELGLEVSSKESISRYDCVKKWTHLHIKVKAVGVFDTVGSVGMSGHVTQPGQDIDWHSTSLHPKIERAFHAMAVDENRGNFPPTLYYQYDATERAGTKLKQCWFPGYHGDIGGHSDADWETNSVDLLTFAWMIDQLTEEGLLQFSKHQLYYPILKRIYEGPENVAGMKAPQSVEEAGERRIKWSDGHLMETNSYTYYATSFIATRRLKFIRSPGEWRQANGKDVNPSKLHESIHPSVYHRTKNSGSPYDPEGLSSKEWSHRSKGDGSSEWVKTVGGKEVTTIPEYQFLNIPKQEYEKKDLWSGSLEQYLAPEDVVGAERYQELKRDMLAQIAELEAQLL
ncbi:hypothetical protein HII31_11215 [Pseudocercospora fuligena]|uniref:T6SS Phospholipase effector Tle1-like catalytic domain-containing protein n=1 Tax=Pseudocercospora fuligena TaxID=685502 RepID=A0A8H6VI09_9PEZI|nr:hypothetical protein HII31_11215 [Pseudocercospora fuligena]